MGKRKVASARHHRTLLGSTTNMYVHDDGPGRLARFGAFTGVAPYNPRRAAITAWVVVFLALARVSPGLPWLFAALSAVVYGLWRLRLARQARAAAIAAARPPAPVPGPTWCDHCAEWTVHATEAHAA